MDKQEHGESTNFPEIPKGQGEAEWDAIQAAYLGACDAVLILMSRRSGHPHPDQSSGGSEEGGRPD